MTRVYRLLAILFALAVVVVSSWPGVSLPDIGPAQIDKVLHFSQYLILAALSAGGWGGPKGRRSPVRIAIALIILIGFAGLDEYHQSWIPGRDPDWRDFLADGLGIGVGFWLGLKFLTRDRQSTLPEGAAVES
jgi:VanZ family protein